ncbi:MAG TPA: hypothetical protein VE136_08175 [Anaerolineales bacterium]|nr:hypothetical protein [Anaerolineales bacterium]
MKSVIAIVTTFMRLTDVPTLASLIPKQGLVITPYGVKPASSRGLTGERLTSTLKQLLENSNPEIVAYEANMPGHIGLVLKGIGRVRVRTAAGAAIWITDLNYVSLDQDKKANWQITTLSPDTRGTLAQAIQAAPFKMVTEYTQPEIVPATPREVIMQIAVLLNKGDASGLAGMVSDKGLAIAPYGLVVRDIGLQDEVLLKTLSILFKGAETRVIYYDLSEEGRIGLVIKGLKRTEVQPAIGDPIMMTSLAYMSLKLEDDGVWRLWLLASDNYGLLAEAMDKPPFKPWK